MESAKAISLSAKTFFNSGFATTKNPDRMWNRFAQNGLFGHVETYVGLAFFGGCGVR